MKKEEFISKIDELIKEPVYLIDIFPNTVPFKPNNRYFEIEEFLQNNREEIDRKFISVLVKLYCYYDFWIASWLPEYETCENPDSTKLISLIKHCFEGELKLRGYIDIFLPECNSVIILNGEDLYMSVYNPTEHLKEIISELSQSEGLFFRKVSEEK